MAKQKSARQRASIIAWHQEHGRSVAETCRRFGVSRSTFYRWRARVASSGPDSLRPFSRRPRRVRVPRWTVDDLHQVIEMACRFPAYGKRRLHRLLTQEGCDLKESAVGRILRIIREGCPICRQRDGRHDAGLHALDSTLGAISPQLKLAERFLSRRRRAKRRPDFTPKNAVEEVERWLKQVRKGGG